MDNLRSFFVSRDQWCKVTKYIYSSTVLKYNVDIFLLYMSISNFQYFYFYSTTSLMCINDIVQCWKWVEFPFKYNFEIFVLYLSKILRYLFTLLEYFQFAILLLLFHYMISEANIVLLLHYNYLKTLVTSYFSDNYDIMKHTLTTLALFHT